MAHVLDLFVYIFLLLFSFRCVSLGYGDSLFFVVVVVALARCLDQAFFSVFLRLVCVVFIRFMFSCHVA